MSETSPTIAFRLSRHDFARVMTEARKTRCKSPHAYARQALFSVLEQDQSGTSAEEIQALRQDVMQLEQQVDNLQVALAKSLQVLLRLHGYDADQAEDFVQHTILTSDTNIPVANHAVNQ